MLTTVKNEKPKRVSWPFRDMEVGEVVGIDKAHAGKGQTYVHVYARQSGKKFTTYTQSDGVLVVERTE